MTMLARGAAPCLNCGTTGGYNRGLSPRPRRVRGLCHTCYNRAHKRLVYGMYPKALSTNHYHRDKPWQPAPWGRVPFGAPPEALPDYWRGCPPRLASAPTATRNPDAHRRTVAAERFADEWLAEREVAA